MTVFQVLEELASKNIELSLTDGLLKYTAPIGTMTDETIRLLTEHKARLIDVLMANQATPTITVQKMDVCLNGKPCRFISLSDYRQICIKNNQPIFDLLECPLGKWTKYNK